jgi:hypothetical protein
MRRGVQNNVVKRKEGLRLCVTDVERRAILLGVAAVMARSSY